MTAVMILMSPLTCVVRGTARLDGRDVQDSQITDVFQNGCSVTARMTAGIIVMNFQKIVQFVQRIQTSSARIIAAFLSNGHAVS